MGRQINFYMLKSVEDQFIDYLSKCEFSCFYNNHDSIEIINFITEWDEKWLVYLHKTRYGKYLNKNGVYSNLMDATISPVIEFSRSSVNEKRAKIRRGRLWIPSEYQLQSCDDFALFTKDYNMLVRWIKKHIPYQDVRLVHPLTDEIYIQKEYINDELLPLLEQGYHLGV